MTDPWAVQEENGQRVYFAQSRIEREERTGNNGNTFFQMTIFLTPIEPELQIVTQKCFNFSPDWQKITIPSVMALVQAGKLQSPADMEQEQYVSYRWTEFKSRAKNDIKYWGEKDKDRIGTDPHGKFVIKRGIEFLDVYPDQATWQNAYNEGVQQMELPVDKNGEGEKSDPALEAAKAAIPTLVAQAGTDMQALQEKFSHPPFDKFGLQDEFVKEAVAKMVATRAGTSADEQEKLLAEINSHFNGDTPYLLIDSPELVKQLDEIAF